MENLKHYPEHPPIMTCEIPLEEYESLKRENAELKETLNNSRNARKYWRKEYLIEYKECSHQKYKRCLAMREYCLCELEFAFRDTCIERSVEGCVRWRKWANTWLYLAEKFKEAK